MAYNYQQVPFWDFVRGFEQHGAGVDHAAEGPAFFDPPQHPFGPPHGPFGFSYNGEHGFGGPGGWGHPGFDAGTGRGGRRGRHWRREQDGSGEEHGARSPSPNGEHAEGEAEAEEGAQEGQHGPRGPRGFGRGGCGRGRGGWARGGPRGGRHGYHGHGPRGPPPPPPPPFGAAGMGSFDLRSIFEALNSHPTVGQNPWVQAFRNWAEQTGLNTGAQRSGEAAVPGENENENENNFVPPIDIFSTETAYVLHIALPGAKKEDVGVNWDSEKGVLNVAGVVYRQGDEEFLKSLTKSERKVGVFERTVKLPPGEEEKEEVHGDAITAKLEDGVLVVTVPKVEKEWTDVKRVDVE
jgi:HSP20 family protein